MLKLLVRFIVILLVMGCAYPQDKGVIIYQQLLDDAAVTPSTSARVTNSGQTSHVFVAFLQDAPGQVCAMPTFSTINPEISYDGITWFASVLPAPTQPTAAFTTLDANGNITTVATMGGAFPFVRASITFDSVNCIVDMFYSGMTTGGVDVISRSMFAGIGSDDGGNGFLGFAMAINSDNVIPTAANYGFDGTAWDRLLMCDTSVVVDIGAAATTEVIALAAGDQIHVCSVSLSMAAAGTVQLVEGTGADCVTAPTDLTGAFSLGASFPLIMGGNLGRLLVGTVAEALCITTTGGGATAEGIITYAQY